MQTTSRKSRFSLIGRLFRKPFQFGFFQAVRLLRRASSFNGNNESEQNHNLVRFKSRLSLESPSAEIHDLSGPVLESNKKGPRKPLSMVVNFLGLTGSSGALPSSYTEFLIERKIKYRDHALRDFLDIFNHRFVDLFYKSWAKHRLYVDWEENQKDGVVRNVLDLLGFGTDNLREKLNVENVGVSDLSIAYYSGIMIGDTRTADGLSSIIQDQFGIKNEVLQFRGQWVKIPEAQCTSLGEHENVLGEGSMLGVMYWDQQSSFRVRLGPLTKTEFESMLPNKKRFERLSSFISFYVGPTLDFDIQVVLARDDAPVCTLGGEKGSLSYLGWSSWLTPGVTGSDMDHSVFQISSEDKKMHTSQNANWVH